VGGASGLVARRCPLPCQLPSLGVPRIRTRGFNLPSLRDYGRLAVGDSLAGGDGGLGVGSRR
jgi:hypothetical protein